MAMEEVLGSAPKWDYDGEGVEVFGASGDEDPVAAEERMLKNASDIGVDGLRKFVIDELNALINRRNIITSSDLRVLIKKIEAK